MKKLIAGLSTLLALSAAGCGGMSVPTFGLFGEKNLERSRVPPNSITYQCAAGKRFYLRYLDNGAAAWVIRSRMIPITTRVRPAAKPLPNRSRCDRPATTS